MFPREHFRMWTGFLVLLLLACISCLSPVEGRRLAVQKCVDYQKDVYRKKQPLMANTFLRTVIKVESTDCSNLVQLIVGGEEAKYGEFPHHALLGYLKEGSTTEYYFQCGGTLISELHVLTAAHCFSNENATIVRLGEYDTSFVSSDEKDFRIAAIRKHPDYKNSKSFHDIALVKLEKSVYFSKIIHPACLWDSEHRNMSNYIATGFGHNETIGKQLSDKMMKVQLDEFPAEDCSRMFQFDRRCRGGLKDGQMCVGSILGGRDTCQGDSGGPLQTIINSKTCIYHVVGITSLGGACGVGQSKSIYTKVSYYIDWIEDNVWGNNAL